MLFNLLASSGENIPPVTEILTRPPLFLKDSKYFFINNPVLITLMSMVIVVLFFGIAFASPKVVPRGLQNLAEVVIDFIRGIINEIIGPKGMVFLPYLTAVFAFIYVNNLFGSMIFVNYPATARLGIPIVLSVLSWIIFQVVGVINQGPKWYVRTIFPTSVPKGVWIIYAPIEFISVFVVRPLSLAVRLGANMVAGHVMLTVFFLFSYFYIEPRISIVVGIPAFILALLLTLFELLVQFLQAYIFTILTAVYIGESMHHEH